MRFYEPTVYAAMTKCSILIEENNKQKYIGNNINHMMSSTKIIILHKFYTVLHDLLHECYMDHVMIKS